MNGLWTVNKCVCTYDQPEISRATKIKDKKNFLANHTQKNIKMKPYRAPDLSFSDGSSKKSIRISILSCFRLEMHISNFN